MEHMAIAAVALLDIIQVVAGHPTPGTCDAGRLLIDSDIVFVGQFIRTAQAKFDRRACVGFQYLDLILAEIIIVQMAARSLAAPMRIVAFGHVPGDAPEGAQRVVFALTQ